MEPLALKYRPRTFDDLTGQRVVQVVLRKMILNNEIRPALLFAGSRGTGQTTSLRILAAALNCDTPPVPCGHCPSCKDIFNGTSLDLIEIDAASHGLVDDIRRLREHVMCATSGRYRVVGLDEAHAISPAGFNALLKVLEEPPPYTVFVLLTTEVHRIPDTVYSRCSPFLFRRIGPADIAARLRHVCQQENLDVEPALLDLFAERSDGAMRNAIMMLDQFSSVGVATVEAFAALVGDTDPGLSILQVLLGGNLAATYATITDILNNGADPACLVDAVTAVLRDVSILRSGGELTAQGDALHGRQQLAQRLTPATILAANRVLWDFRTKIRLGEQTRPALDLATAMLAEVLVPTPPPATPAAAGRLSLADMAAIR